jgi:hypothetical protein
MVGAMGVRPEEDTMGIARIGCGRYSAGHDVHFIAVRVTADRPGIDGTVQWVDDHAVLTATTGVWVLCNHDPERFRQAVEASVEATLLEGSHLLWLDIRTGDGRIGRACFNISITPPEPCDAADDSLEDGLIEGGN